MNEDEVEGKAKKAVGPLQDGYDKVREKVRDIAADPSAAAREAYATGRDYARRGAETVTRVAVDNTALTALVAGAAVAVVGWLVLGRRKTRGDGGGRE